MYIVATVRKNRISPDSFPKYRISNCMNWFDSHQRGCEISTLYVVIISNSKAERRGGMKIKKYLLGLDMYVTL